EIAWAQGLPSLAALERSARGARGRGVRGDRLAITDRRAERRTGRNLSGGAGGEWNADWLGYRYPEADSFPQRDHGAQLLRQDALPVLLPERRQPSDRVTRSESSDRLLRSRTGPRQTDQCRHGDLHFGNRRPARHLYRRRRFPRIWGLGGRIHDHPERPC